MFGYPILTPAGLVLLVLLAVATVSDHRQRRIPNWLTYPTMLLALALSLATSAINSIPRADPAVSQAIGALPLPDALLGGAVCGAIMLVLYLSMGIGAGDVKLLTAIGLIVGVRQGLMVLILGQMLAALAVVSWALWCGGFSNITTSLVPTAVAAQNTTTDCSSAPDDIGSRLASARSPGVPMAGAFAAATLYVLWTGAGT